MLPETIIKMYYFAVIDTNVIVSAALKWNSIPGEIVNYVLSGVIIPVINDEIIAEYSKVLSRPKFHLTPAIVRSIVESITSRSININNEKFDIDLPDPKDRVFYEITMTHRKEHDTYLVTGNIRHFPAEPYVVTPHQMAEIIRAGMDR